MTLAIGACKTGYPEYQQQAQQAQAQQQGGPSPYLPQAPPYHLHGASPQPSSPSSSSAATASHSHPVSRCCPSSSSSTTASTSSAASSRRGSREAGGAGAWYYCCCCCTAPRPSRSRRRSLLASLGVCALVLVYTVIGAFAFMALEGSGFSRPTSSPGGASSISPSSSASSRTPTLSPEQYDLRVKTVEKLWSITEDLNILYKDNWTRLAAEEVLRFQNMLVQNLREQGAATATSTRSGDSTRAVATAASKHNFHTSHHWTFASSFLYSLTLITTIGYGSVSPRTTWGRLVSISYAIIGIPLMLLYLSTMGESLARSFRRAYGRMCVRRGSSEKCRKQKPGKSKVSKSSGKPSLPPSGKAPAATMKNHNCMSPSIGTALGASDELTVKADRAMIVVDCGIGDGVGLSGGAAPPLDSPASKKQSRQGHSSARVPVVLCLSVLVAYVCGGACIFRYLEDWTFVEGSYFCFTSLGTIGFGDLVPGRAHQPLAAAASATAPWWRGEVVSVLAASVYILLGMALVAMTFSLVQEEFVGLLRRLGRHCSSRAARTSSSAGSDSESNAEPAGPSEAIPMSVVSSS